MAEDYRDENVIYYKMCQNADKKTICGVDHQQYKRHNGLLGIVIQKDA